ncbi:MAG: hypothetical protein H8E09_00155 [Gammaproteobacteria bacterium]|nr:hypothetical protein [Gammaproteobacteria bacterium]
MMRFIFLILTLIGFGLFAALIWTHGENHNLQYDYYVVVIPVFAGALIVAIAGVLSAP